MQNLLVRLCRHKFRLFCSCFSFFVFTRTLRMILMHQRVSCTRLLQTTSLETRNKHAFSLFFGGGGRICLRKAICCTGSSIVSLKSYDWDKFKENNCSVLPQTILALGYCKSKAEMHYESSKNQWRSYVFLGLFILVHKFELYLVTQSL